MPLPDAEKASAWTAGHRRTVDAALVAVVLAMFEMPAFDPYRHDSRQWWPAWGAVIALPLLWRRRQPVAALAVSVAGVAGALLTRSGPNWGALSQATLFVGPAIAVAGAGATLSRAVSKRLALATAVVIAALTVATQSAPDTMLAQLAVVGGAWAVGEAGRARRHEIALLQELVERRAAQAADLERARIARELHDVVAHQLAVIAIQAGAARMTAAAVGDTWVGADAVGAPLDAIEEAARVALSDVRRALGVLRHPDEEAGALAPQPGLAQLAGLAMRLRDAGLPLDVSTSGSLDDLPDGVAVSAYRILQEALTNVVNHAGRVPTRVRVDRSPTELALEVRNDPAPIVVVGDRLDGGRGLLGMRERVAAYCGTLDAGPVPGGGFSVRARIPLT